jgi:adenine-specific DNA glycosylase
MTGTKFRPTLLARFSGYSRDLPWRRSYAPYPVVGANVERLFARLDDIDPPIKEAQPALSPATGARADPCRPSAAYRGGTRATHSPGCGAASLTTPRKADCSAPCFAVE